MFAVSEKPRMVIKMKKAQIPTNGKNKLPRIKTFGLVLGVVVIICVIFSTDGFSFLGGDNWFKSGKPTMSVFIPQDFSFLPKDEFNSTGPAGFANGFRSGAKIPPLDRSPQLFAMSTAPIQEFEFTDVSIEEVRGLLEGLLGSTGLSFQTELTQGYTIGDLFSSLQGISGTGTLTVSYYNKNFLEINYSVASPSGEQIALNVLSFYDTIPEELTFENVRNSISKVEWFTFSEFNSDSKLVKFGGLYFPPLAAVNAPIKFESLDGAPYPLEESYLALLWVRDRVSLGWQLWYNPETEAYESPWEFTPIWK